MELSTHVTVNLNWCLLIFDENLWTRGAAIEQCVLFPLPRYVGKKLLNNYKILIQNISSTL